MPSGLGGGGMGWEGLGIGVVQRQPPSLTCLTDASGEVGDEEPEAVHLVQFTRRLARLVTAR